MQQLSGVEELNSSAREYKDWHMRINICGAVEILLELIPLHVVLKRSVREEIGVKEKEG